MKRQIAEDVQGVEAVRRVGGAEVEVVVRGLLVRALLVVGVASVDDWVSDGAVSDEVGIGKLGEKGWIWVDNGVYGCRPCPVRPVLVGLRTDSVVCLDAAVEEAGLRRREADAGLVGGPIAVVDGRLIDGNSAKGIGGDVEVFTDLVLSFTGS